MDATPLTEASGGVSRYTAELTRALAQTFPEDEFLLLSDQTFANPAARQPNVACGSGPRTALERRWWFWGLPRELQRRDAAVFHGTGFSVPYFPVRPSVLTLHDLSPWLDPAWHHEAGRVRTRTPMLLRLGLATLVITPTEAIRRQAIARFRLAPSRVFAVHHGASELFRPVPLAEPPAVPYLLFTGTLEPRKNLPLVFEVWREVRRAREIDLVIVGRRRADGPQIEPEPGLHLLGMVPDESLPALYSGCLACLYPSLYEGFGLPVLEAMQCGAPVFTSQDPALLETGGSAAVTLDVRRPQDWVEALSAIAENAEWAGVLRDASLKRAADFSWEKAARQTHAVYDEAVERG